MTALEHANFEMEHDAWELEKSSAVAAAKKKHMDIMRKFIAKQSEEEQRVKPDWQQMEIEDERARSMRHLKEWPVGKRIVLGKVVFGTTDRQFEFEKKLEDLH